MAIKEFTEKQLKAIELVAKGENNTRVSELVGVNRKTIISWKKDDKFKAEVDKQVTLLKSKVEEKIAMNIEPLMEKLIKIALTSDNEKTSLDAITYAINRFVGTPTSKQEISTTDNSNNNKEVSIEDMLQDLEVDNVINLEDKKVK
ncbi:MAG: phBC6A51 family helix-turn-helix protein [Clostridium sp.]|uniref:phBC6A51 family helix-turn-helix protein n=1 Tax=Clostridium sp. TaxID=1506 RepID=UPI0028FE018B|nr:phBC6A51 family helix-turn-helix protein [Clostridium sp.]MDU1603519.1 phBC6A51 family helix-turn-helix protein [Clostridium sp.]